MPSVLSEVRRSYTPEQETMIIEPLHGALATRPRSPPGRPRAASFRVPARSPTRPSASTRSPAMTAMYTGFCQVAATEQD